MAKAPTLKAPPPTLKAPPPAPPAPAAAPSNPPGTPPAPTPPEPPPAPPAAPATPPTPPAAPPATPPTPPAAPPAVSPETGVPPNTAPTGISALANEDAGDASPPPAAPVAGDNENGAVTTNAEAKGATLASDAQRQPAPDRDANGQPGGSLPVDPQARAERVSDIGFEDGKVAYADREQGDDEDVAEKIAEPKKQPREWDDNEYGRYTASYWRGVEQQRVNEMSDEDRILRLERAAGLLSPETE